MSPVSQPFSLGFPFVWVSFGLGHILVQCFGRWSFVSWCWDLSSFSSSFFPSFFSFFHTSFLNNCYFCTKLCFLCFWVFLPPVVSFMGSPTLLVLAIGIPTHLLYRLLFVISLFRVTASSPSSCWVICFGIRIMYCFGRRITMFSAPGVLCICW